MRMSPQRSTDPPGGAHTRAGEKENGPCGTWEWEWDGASDREERVKRVEWDGNGMKGRGTEVGLDGVGKGMR